MSKCHVKALGKGFNNLARPPHAALLAVMGAVLEECRRVLWTSYGLACVHQLVPLAVDHDGRSGGMLPGLSPGGRHDAVTRDRGVS